MQRIQGFARLPTGAPAPSCTVTVYDAGTVNPSTIYSDDLQVPTAKANPFLASAAGFWFFYAAAGKLYDVTFSGGGLAAPYTLADMPAGLGDGGVASCAYASLPLTSAAHDGRLRRVQNLRQGLFIDDGTGWNSVLDYGFDSCTYAALPAAGVAGRVRRVTDTRQGLYVDTGAAWVPLLAYALESHTYAALPAAALAGRLRRVTNVRRGVWMDSGTAWFGLSGEVANAVEFGAVRDGVTDDAAAIQAAIDACAAGGTVILPPGSYAVSVPLLIRDGVTLRGIGATILTAAGWAGDAILQTYRRDDNTPANEDRIRIEGLTIQAPAVAGLSAIDLCGACNSLVLDVVLTGAGAAWNASALRLANRNPAATSIKRCQNNTIIHVKATGWRTFLVAEQTVATTADRNLIAGFEATTVRVGIDFTGFSAGSARLVLASGQFVGDNDAASAFISRGANPLPKQLELIQVDAATFVNLTDYPSELWRTCALGVTASGTTAAAPLASGGALAQDFSGSAYLSLTAGAALAAGVNTYVYTLTNAPTGGVFEVIPVSGLPTAPVSMQAALAAGILTVTVVASWAVVLPADFVFRVVQVLP